MEWIRIADGRWIASLVWCVLILGGTGCSLTNGPGRMEWVQPTTSAVRVGTAYCIRGWKGYWSAGIDQIAKQLNEKGMTARVYMPEQVFALRDEMIAKYRNSPNHEPIVFIGHSRGVDASIIIARELEKVGVNVEMIVCMDSVDETTVSKNVRICHNYWMPGIFLDTNLLRGIPLKLAPGSTGQLFNYDCNKEYRSWRSAWTNHINFDDDPLIQKRIVEQVLEVCPERSAWSPPAAGVSVASK